MLKYILIYMLVSISIYADSNINQKESSFDNIENMLQKSNQTIQEADKQVEKIQLIRQNAKKVSNVAELQLRLYNLYKKDSNDKKLEFIYKYYSFVMKPILAKKKLKDNEKHLLRDMWAKVRNTIGDMQYFSDDKYKSINFTILNNSIQEVINTIPYYSNLAKKSSNDLIWSKNKKNRRLRNNPFLGLKSFPVEIGQKNSNILTPRKGTPIENIYYSVLIDGISWSKISIKYTEKNILSVGWIKTSVIKKLKL